VVLSNSSGVPLYQQIKEQVGTAVLSGELVEGPVLPSVRAPARDLRISVITTTRAYAELATEGFIATVPGKGAYVLPLDSGIQPADIEELLLHGAAAVVLSRSIDLQLQVSQPTLEFLEERDVKAYVAETTEAVQIYNELAATQPVGGLFHSTC